MYGQHRWSFIRFGSELFLSLVYYLTSCSVASVRSHRAWDHLDRIFGQILSLFIVSHIVYLVTPINFGVFTSVNSFHVDTSLCLVRNLFLLVYSLYFAWRLLGAYFPSRLFFFGGVFCSTCTAGVSGNTAIVVPWPTQQMIITLAPNSQNNKQMETKHLAEKNTT